jgi:hypothetical protein
MKTKNGFIIFLQLFTAGAGILGIFESMSAMAASSAKIQAWLQTHNTYRHLHDVSPVTWSDTVAASAQAYADTCPSGHSGSGYGENIAWASYMMDESSVVKMWYDEESLYDYNNPGFSSDTGHFTQVVWKETTEIGCGFATGCGKDGRSLANVWVCQYNPPGNYQNRFAENVFPPDSGNGDTPPETGDGNEDVDLKSMTSIFQLLLL